MAALISMGLTSIRLEGPFGWQNGAAQAEGVQTISGNAGVAGATLTFTEGSTNAEDSPLMRAGLAP